MPSAQLNMHVTDDFRQCNASLSVVLSGARHGSALLKEYEMSLESFPEMVT